MAEVIIQVENISKLYRLGKIGTGSLRKDLHYWWNSRVRNKDPFETRTSDNTKDFLWALKDINFEVLQGEALGIIGSNGSGKSTLLKIISRIVQPTTGAVRGKGKISSILEVGTGFHHELSGRENIFISGYTLGMKKEEIIRKFDEIVAFSGVEKFIDTPVKRYSSGMYVRLAFAVAAHLEPDILIVDEVLAVGDAEFQKKCMGKMQSVSSSQGRTILFVSHNMQAVSNLCSKAIWLKEGKVEYSGGANEVVTRYIASAKVETSNQSWNDPDSAPGNEFIKMKSVEVKPRMEGAQFITVRTPIQMDFEFWCFIDNCTININVQLLTTSGECIFNLGTGGIQAEKAIIGLETIIPGNLLNNSTYIVALTIVKNHSIPICEFHDCASIEVEDVREGMNYFDTWHGIIRPEIDNYLYLKEYL
jgi:lipopolysaccharide transport system ATP-binding protein